MPPSATLIANLTTRQDLNYPSAAEVQSALEKKKGNGAFALCLDHQSSHTKPLPPSPTNHCHFPAQTTATLP